MTKGKQPTIGERYEAKRLKHLDIEARNRKRIANYNRDLKIASKKYRSKAGLINLLIEQGRKCSICDKDLAEISKHTHWDHCHKTGKLRGILCHNCNVGIGHFKDNTASLERAIAYLENWKDTHEMKSPYKYDIIDQKPIYNGRVSYLIRHVAKNGGEHEEWIGIVKMRRLIKQERINNPPAEFRNYRDEEGNVLVVGSWNVKDMDFTPKVEPVSGYDEINVPKEPPYKDKPVSNWAKLKEEMEKPKVWNLADEFKVDQEQEPVATGRAYYIEKDGRYCVVLPDGTLDDEWTNLMMAEIYRDSLNNPSSTEKEKGS